MNSNSRGKTIFVCTSFVFGSNWKISATAVKQFHAFRFRVEKIAMLPSHERVFFGLDYDVPVSLHKPHDEGISRALSCS